MIEYIIGGTFIVIFSIFGGYSKYKSYEYRKVIQHEEDIDYWITSNRKSYRGIRERVNLLRSSSKE